MEDEKEKERTFTVELTSSEALRYITLDRSYLDKALIEGTLGVLLQARYTEGVILEVHGSKGTLRVDLGYEETIRPGKDGISVEEGERW